MGKGGHNETLTERTLSKREESALSSRACLQATRVAKRGWGVPRSESERDHKCVCGEGIAPTKLRGWTVGNKHLVHGGAGRADDPRHSEVIRNDCQAKTARHGSGRPQRRCECVEIGREQG
jgi:hypothetical protein